MDKKEKKKLSESDICDLFITPAIKNAGWDPLRQIRREVTLTQVHYFQVAPAGVMRRSFFPEYLSESGYVPAVAEKIPAILT